MTLKVLQDKAQINQARHKLIDKGVSSIESSWQFFLRALKFRSGISVGDRVKSWDVFSTLDFIESHVRKNEPILDIGSYASETIVALHKLGYSNLSGLDLNANLMKMPYQSSIYYEINDFLRTGFKDASFQAITSISVIEHGFESKLLLKEVSRLLKPNGYFIASFDYWVEKIDTTGLRYFGMDWKIFSKEEIRSFVFDAAEYGLFPSGEMMYDVKDKPISCGGKRYTFAWLVLVRRA